MRVAALKMGFGVPERDFDGTVHSVFPNACIVSLAGTVLVTLVPARVGGLPFGITLATADDPGFDRTIGAGAPVAARAGILRIGDAELAVDLRCAAPWRSRLDAIGLDMTAEASRANWEIAARLLATDGRANGLLAIAGEPIAAILRSTRDMTFAETVGNAGLLVGLGQGGTPAGDDFLVGFAAALRCVARQTGPHNAFATAFAAKLSGMAQQTNDVSRVYLEAAAAGEISEKLTAVAQHIAEGSPAETVAGAVALAIAAGHTSGADGMLGLLAGMAAWGPDAVAVAAARLIRPAK